MVALDSLSLETQKQIWSYVRISTWKGFNALTKTSKTVREHVLTRSKFTEDMARIVLDKVATNGTTSIISV
jgi:hypothetical protein